MDPQQAFYGPLGGPWIPGWEPLAYGMEVNVKKTECMVMTKKESVRECRITIKGEMVKQVNNFKYLGSNIKSHGRCVTEVKCRIPQA